MLTFKHTDITIRIFQIGLGKFLFVKKKWQDKYIIIIIQKANLPKILQILILTNYFWLIQ